MLERLQLPFSSASPDIDESPNPSESPVELVSRLSEEKARCVAEDYTNALIIGSDQVAQCGKRLLTKPGTRENAIEQLSYMSGKRLIFHTGLCVFNGQTQTSEIDVIDYGVTFRKLSAAEIERYLDIESPYNCAGSFKSEGLGISLLEKMDGDDPTALIGLPLIRLCKMLRHLGIKLP